MNPTAFRHHSVPTQSSKRIWFTLGLIAFGSAVVLAGTPWGIGLSPDSVAYVRAARSIVSADFSSLPTQWPPAYPAVVALFTLLTRNPLEAAAIAQGAILGVNLALFANIAGRLGARLWIGAALAALLMMQTPFLQAHLVLWSEPLFIALVLGNIILLERAVKEDARLRDAALVGLVAAAAIMTRYAGLYLIAANALVLLHASPWTLSTRLNRCLSATVAALVPLAMWIGYSFAHSGGGRSPKVIFHGLDPARIDQLRETAASWLHLPLYLSALTGVWVLFLLILASRRPAAPAPSPLARIIAVHLCSYAALILVTVLLVYANTPLDGRILLPAQVLAFLLLANAIGWARSQRWIALAVIPCLASLAMNAPGAFDYWRGSIRDGIGFAHRQVRTIPLLELLATLPADLRVATNGVELFTLYLPHSAKPLPRWGNPMSREVNQHLNQDVERMIKESDMLVHFQLMAWRGYQIGPDELDTLTEFERVYRGPDGSMWIKK